MPYKDVCAYDGRALLLTGFSGNVGTCPARKCAQFVATNFRLLGACGTLELAPDYLWS